MHQIQIARYETDSPDRNSIRSLVTDSPGSGNVHRVAGTGIQDPKLVEITSQAGSGLAARQDQSQLTLKHTITAEFAQSPFEAGGYLHSPVIEHVLQYFPASRVTPAFKAQIETEFDRFYAFNKDHQGGRGLVRGWSTGESSHDELDENARVFVVLKGWESMQHFQRSIQTDAFKESIKILLPWGVPWEMVRLMSSGAVKHIADLLQWHIQTLKIQDS